MTPARGPPLAIDFPIVGIGASAGGLEACSKLLDAMPVQTGMAFILVQHLDPYHDSMLVELLGSHTSMVVIEATNGMPIVRDHLYVIPPGTYLAIEHGLLKVTPSSTHHGARLPFDALLRSMAEACGSEAICVVLSGTGTDGTLGLSAVKKRSGRVIVQDPNEAAYDGMVRSAIATGLVDQVLSLSKIPAALLRAELLTEAEQGPIVSSSETVIADHLVEIINLLRENTTHDFSLYKPGTLERRIERRMSSASIDPSKIGSYIARLRSDPLERGSLAKDMLINVTSFFRDSEVFAYLQTEIIPDLLHQHTIDQPFRLWIAGCSTGEETYSLAMLLREQAAEHHVNLRLQIFASDADPDAVAIARDGLYPKTITDAVSTARLARFFSVEEDGYRVLPELRSMIVFTVQDVLVDPPFSRLDMISCRNLLIYLRPEAQARVIAAFHFALRENGILLLGNAETIAHPVGRFEVISKSERIYRQVGHTRPGDFNFNIKPWDIGRDPSRVRPSQAPSREDVLAELCKQLVLDAHAPAAVLVNRKLECLYAMGPTDRYLRVAVGRPTQDILAMARQDVRTKLRSAIQQAVRANSYTKIAGGQIGGSGDFPPYIISVQPIKKGEDELLLICFVESISPAHRQSVARPSKAMPRLLEMQNELETTRAELRDAIRNLETVEEDQKAINEEALSVNEEFQSTNEELLTSKEELQSLNEELTALNSQLQETLERQRTTSNDLQNVLYSTDVATLFLDSNLNIRFFTPATRSLFNLIHGDIGRPISDLHSLAVDGALQGDAYKVLKTHEPIEKEIEASTGLWYLRRILPYMTDNNGVGGVVITFGDITERKRSSDALEAAKREAELATVAKSRFLAAASHDLRQPLQTLQLLQGLLAKFVQDSKASSLVARMDDTMGAMSAMLNTLLDINQIDSGTVRVEKSTFLIGDLLSRLEDEFSYHAKSRGLVLRVVLSTCEVRSDVRLLEQILRNFISNALKYTKTGKVLLGCRHRSGNLSIEVWDTGAGIAEAEFEPIFEEYHQLDNAHRERSRGLGLGLSIVRGLSVLLGHNVTVRSQLGKGSVFAIEIARSLDAKASLEAHKMLTVQQKTNDVAQKIGKILVIEDDTELRELLEMFLKEEGHRTASASDGASALKLLADGIIFRPDIILSDFNLPGAMDGLQVSDQLRERLGIDIPVVILTGDISAAALRNIAAQKCIQLTKPVKLNDLSQVLQGLLAATGFDAHTSTLAENHVGSLTPIIYVVDDDRHVRDAIRSVLEDDQRSVETYDSSEAFLKAYRPGQDGCLLIDAHLPGMSGIELLGHLRHRGDELPAIVITGSRDVAMAVQAMKAGASDFIEKPMRLGELLADVNLALEHAKDVGKLSASRDAAAHMVASLTARQRQIMDMVLAGQPSKNIAADLGISQRTVENHRASVMEKTGAKSLPALARLALAAGWQDGGESNAPKTAIVRASR